MKFPVDQFERFANVLSVETKESGIVRLGSRMLGTQKYLLREIARGFEDDKHFVVVLKGRQLGITTFSLALDLWWQFMHPGFSGTLVTDTEENRDMFRSTLSMYMNGLPKRFRVPLVNHNRTQLVLKNRSRLLYQVAGTRNNGGLGRGKAITYLHGTEISSWGSEEGLASLTASCAETNPLRLFIWESTARGFDMFYEMWRAAEHSKTQNAIFVGWWRNELYRLPKGSALYLAYWDGRMKPEEREWVKEVKALYDFEIEPEQLAWWRWKSAEGVKDELLMMQEFPPLPSLAFISTGSNFFSGGALTAAMTQAVKSKPQRYRMDFGANFYDTRLIRAPVQTADLEVWEEPVAGATYIIGADPAYGSSEWADRFCVSVLRVWADGMETVAEFCSSGINPYQFAWVVCYLGGAYAGATVNLEMNGPGQSVKTEMQNLKRQIQVMPQGAGNGLFDVISSMKSYLWRRQDSLHGPGSTIGWITTQQTKERMLTYMKDYFERGMLKIHGADLLDEMKTLRREGSMIAAAGLAKDDRVIACALACAAYAEQVQPALIMMRRTKEAEAHANETPAITNAAERSVRRWMDAIGMNR